jgi:hypothetical protein
MARETKPTEAPPLLATASAVARAKSPTNLPSGGAPEILTNTPQ